MANIKKKAQIEFDETKLINDKEKAAYLFKILKESNRLIEKKQNLTLSDLLMGQLQLCSEQKESICAKKTKEMSQLMKEFEDLSEQINSQKDLTLNYEKKIDTHLNNIETQAKNELNLLTKQRIQKEIEFTNRIDQKLSKFTQDLTDNLKSTNKQHQSQNSPYFQLISNNLKTLKRKQHQISIQLAQNQNKMLQNISKKITEFKALLVKLLSETNKLDLLILEIEQFQKFALSKINQMKQARTQKEQQIIEIIEQIISVIAKNKPLTLQSS